jgi:hypothetical protein
MRGTADMLRALRKRRFGGLLSIVTGIMFLLIVLATGQAESASLIAPSQPRKLNISSAIMPLSAREMTLWPTSTQRSSRVVRMAIFATKQRRWLSTFQACADATCVKDYYDDRINALMDTKGGRELSTHFFTKGSNGNEGRLSVFGPQHGWLAVSIFRSMLATRTPVM